jgi:broad specificity phosphatase PhoE
VGGRKRRRWDVKFGIFLRKVFLPRFSASLSASISAKFNQSQRSATTTTCKHNNAQPKQTPSTVAQRHLYILRHGQTDYNLNHKIQGRGINAPLNDTGRWQASRVAEVLREKPLERLYSSGMDRAIQTAEAIEEVKGLQNSPFTELDEMDFGRLEGLDYNDDQVELQWMLQEWSKGNGEARATGGESAIEVFERANTKFQELLATAGPDESLAFVLHG